MASVELRTLHAGDSSWQRWWSHKGAKMAPGEINLTEKWIELENGHIARISIAKVQDQHFPGWLVKWRVMHDFRGLDVPVDETKGQVMLTEEQLRAAFCLADTCDEEATEPAKKFGADIYVIGRFIRQGPYLNIPGPGTGMNRDANISIEVHAEIRRAVERLLA